MNRFTDNFLSPLVTLIFLVPGLSKGIEQIMNRVRRPKINYLLDVWHLALVASSDHGLGHLVLDVGSLPDLSIFLDLFAAKRDGGDLSAEAAALLAALGVEARKDFVVLLRHVHDGGEGAEGTLLEPIKSGLKMQRR